MFVHVSELIALCRFTYTDAMDTLAEAYKEATQLMLKYAASLMPLPVFSQVTLHTGPDVTKSYAISMSICPE